MISLNHCGALEQIREVGGTNVNRNVWMWVWVWVEGLAEWQMANTT